MNINQLIEDFNQRVIAAHNAHYENNPSGLIDEGPNASPNQNQIYHLYSSGDVTHQKGAWAYLRRSEYHIKEEINGAEELPFCFVEKTTQRKITYAVLTQEECLKFREEMLTIINNKNL